MFERFYLQTRPIDHTSPARFYTLTVTKNLFGDPCLQVYNDSLGKKFQSLSYTFNTLKDLNKKRDFLLKRRLTSKKRLGVNYELLIPSEMNILS